MLKVLTAEIPMRMGEFGPVARTLSSLNPRRPGGRAAGSGVPGP
ncbi:hypothetical protein ACFQMH_34230 [Streptomyces viridiviolaceus]|uniref:Uncharacterized protein n=1 Tax=Streptomyces viridiviolaceus TaxID=68282 RepID=A0ABW2EE26_9ACTN|nr:hypothetical protein [Streptomyces viridiviolaceus]